MNFKHVYETKMFWIVEHLLFLGIPIMFAIMQYPDNPPVFYSIMIGSIVYSALLARFHGATLADFGIQKKYFKEAVFYLTIPTILVGFIILAGKFILPQAYVRPTSALGGMILYVLFSVPIQQLLFRGLCTWRCSITWKDNWQIVVLFNAFNFGMMHMVFHNWYFVVGTFLINLFWSYAYHKYPNLFALMLSHAVLGTLYFLPV